MGPQNFWERVEKAELGRALLEANDHLAQSRIHQHELAWLQASEVQSGGERIQMSRRTEKALRKLAGALTESLLEPLLPESMFCIDYVERRLRRARSLRFW